MIHACITVMEGLGRAKKRKLVARLDRREELLRSKAQGRFLFPLFSSGRGGLLSLML